MHGIFTIIGYCERRQMRAHQYELLAASSRGQAIAQRRGELAKGCGCVHLEAILALDELVYMYCLSRKRVQINKELLTGAYGPCLQPGSESCCLRIADQ